MKKLLLLAVSALLTSSLFADTYYIAGDGSASNNWCCGMYWKEAGCELTGNSKSFELAAGTYNFKVTDGTWSRNWGYSNVSASSTAGYVDGGGNNVQFTLGTSATVTVSFDPTAEQITLTSTVPFGPLEITSWTVCGSDAVFGTNFDPTDTNNDMSFVGGVYQLKKSGVALAADGIYEYKYTANHSWGIKEFPGMGNLNFTVETDGTYDVTFYWNAATEEENVVTTLSTSADEADADEAEVVAIYNMIGQPVPASYEGVKVIVYSNGKVEKKY